ncbi:MAG: hypothetical protein AAFQ68_23150, partial [Bacteroidota bacterium]
LIWSADLSQTADEVEDILQQASSRFGTQKHQQFGWGTVDAVKAVKLAGAVGTPVPQPLTAGISGPLSINSPGNYRYYSNVGNSVDPLVRKWKLNGQVIGYGSSILVPFVGGQNPIFNKVELEVEEVGCPKRYIDAEVEVSFYGGGPQILPQ